MNLKISSHKCADINIKFRNLSMSISFGKYSNYSFKKNGV